MPRNALCVLATLLFLAQAFPIGNAGPGTGTITPNFGPVFEGSPYDDYGYGICWLGTTIYGSGTQVVTPYPNEIVYFYNRMDNSRGGIGPGMEYATYNNGITTDGYLVYYYGSYNQGGDPGPFLTYFSPTDSYYGSYNYGSSSQNAGFTSMVAFGGSVYGTGWDYNVNTGTYNHFLYSIPWNDLGTYNYKYYESSNWDESSGITSDGTYLYICGRTTGHGRPSATDYDMFLEKRDTAGNFAQAVTWDGGSSTGEIYACAAYYGGYIYIAGTRITQSSGNDVYILKYDTNLALQWAKTWSAPGDDSARAIVVDADGIFITGATNSRGAGGYDALLLKYTFDGTCIVDKTWGGGADDIGNAICLGNGPVYVCGTTTSFGSGARDIFYLGTNHFGTDGNTLPEAVINPGTPSSANQYDSVPFSGYGNDIDGGIIAYEWRSDIDGIIGSQPSFSTASLSVGHHNIYLRVQDNYPEWSPEVSIAIDIKRVNKPPAATINLISPASAYEGAEIVFNGAGDDPDGYVAEYKWESSKDGVLGTAENFTTSNLSVGTHSITFSVMDNEGAWSPPASGSVTVVPLGQNLPPIATIISISPSSSIFGDTVSFIGNATDPDGTVSGMTWESSLMGALANNYNFSASNLTVGNHTIMFSVHDNNGTWSAKDTREITVLPPGTNRRPVINWASATPNPCYVGEKVAFTANATDPDGTVAKYSWTSDYNGNLSSNQSFATGGLLPRNHTIRLYAMDDNGSWSDPYSFALRVMQNGTNKPPTAAIESVTPSLVHQGDRVYFNGTGTDPDGYVASYGWSSNLSGFLSGNHSFSRNDLPVGTHLITFTATDDQGAVSAPDAQVLQVYPLGANLPPSAHIAAITPSPATAGQMVTFTGYGTDADGNITGYEWSSSSDGAFGATATVLNYSLSVGNHTISFRVRDNSGAWSAPASAALQITKPAVSKPLAYIDMISPNPAQEGQNVTFSGHGWIDAADTQPSAYRWRSSLAGTDLSGQKWFITAALEPGNHTIYFSVQSAQGAWSDEASLILRVRAKPVIPPLPALNVTAALSNATVLAGRSITITITVFDGTAPLSNATVVAWSDSNGAFAEAVYAGNGTYLLNYTAPALDANTNGIINLTVNVSGYQKYQKTFSIRINAPEPDRNLISYYLGIGLMILIPLCIVVAILILAAIYRRDKKRKILILRETQSQAPDGSGTKTIHTIEEYNPDTTISIPKTVIADAIATCEKCKGNFSASENKIVCACGASYHFVCANKLGNCPKCSRKIVTYTYVRERVSNPIDEIFLIYNDGRLIKHLTRRIKPESDADILASMFTAVQSFVKDSFKEAGYIDEFKFGEFTAIQSRGKKLSIVVLIAGKSAKDIREQLKATVAEIEVKYKTELQDWDGTLVNLAGTAGYLEKLMEGGYRQSRLRRRR